MRYRVLSPLAVIAAGFALFAMCSATLGQTAKPSAAAPLMGLLDRFTAAGVPAMGPSETEVVPLKWDKTTPPGLPGNGMAQHPMLYIGEGYNKILLVNKGKIIWTYSTGDRLGIRRRVDALQRQHSVQPHAIRGRGDA